MKYVIPKLHSLSGRKTQGNCANGSAAGSISDTCTTGTGIDNRVGAYANGYCSGGAGDATWCTGGTAAYDGGTHCVTGTGPNSTCATGGTPVP